MTKANLIFLNALPVLVMIGFIPLIESDYWLASIYILIIIVSLLIRKEKSDLPVLVFGFFAMILSEMLFVSTGVETFKRKSLFGLMPLWLPFLWAYGFVAIKRNVQILD